MCHNNYMTITEGATYTPLPTGTKVRFTDGLAEGSFRSTRGVGHIAEFTPYTGWVGMNNGAPHPGGGWYTVTTTTGSTVSVEHKNVAEWTAKPKGAPKAPRPNIEKPDPATLPRITAFDGVTDSGEYGNARCPHCGAEGRYVYHFYCEDGTRRGAMAGCIKLYPVSPVAEEHKRIIDRQAKREKTGGELASWDQTKLEAINHLIDGETTEDEAMQTIQAENAKRQAWLDRRSRR